MKLLILLESSEDDGGANAHVVVGAKASAADRRESLAMVDLWRLLKIVCLTDD